MTLPLIQQKVKSDAQVLQEVLPDSDVDFRLVILVIVVLGVPLSK